MICQFLLICFVVCVCKISDKTDKFFYFVKLQQFILEYRFFSRLCICYCILNKVEKDRFCQCQIVVHHVITLMIMVLNDFVSTRLLMLAGSL